jgi:SAM-dependent methyltransferase
MSEEFYNQLAPYYKLLYRDWEASLESHAAQLDSIIRECIGGEAQSILDAACGIGTQSIGLSRLGYQVTGSDLSPAEVEVARREAAEHGVYIPFSVADMRQLWGAHQNQFDVVIACDNAIPHLLSEDDILLAFHQIQRCTKTGGGCLISVRDYEKMHFEGIHLYPRHVHQTSSGKVILFDLWEFQGSFYDLTIYIIEDWGKGEARTTVIRGGRYYCVTIPTLKKLMKAAGFVKIRTLRDRYFQPVIVAHKC